MESFVNREPELKLIDESFSALLDGNRLLRTPIIEVQGVGGIGKTSLLRQIEHRCDKIHLPYIWIDVSQHASDVALEIVEQVRRYTRNSNNEILDDTSPIHAIKVLLKQGPGVMLFDAVDTANTTQLVLIEDLLKDLIEDSKLFVVLACKKTITFQQHRSLARKLTVFTLKVLERKDCEVYLDTLKSSIEPEIRNLIFEWTRGYPRAMNVLAQAVLNGLDLRTLYGRQEALSLLKEQVINQGVLAASESADKHRYFAALQLFSIPRRFNLIIMQDLIETFSPELKLESSIAYWGLPKEINDLTDVLNWNMMRAGFSVDEPLRRLFLLFLRIEHAQRYFAIHEFLAQTNLRLVREVSGSDRVRYIRECLYHTACLIASPSTIQRLKETLQILEHEPLETLLQFFEEFSQDIELKEVLGDYLEIIQEEILRYQPNINTNVQEG